MYQELNRNTTPEYFTDLNIGLPNSVKSLYLRLSPTFVILIFLALTLGTQISIKSTKQTAENDRFISGQYVCYQQSMQDDVLNCTEFNIVKNM